MCGYRCLRTTQIIIAFLNIPFYYVAIIIGIVIAATDDFNTTTQIRVLHIVLGVFAMASASIGIVQGFCGSIKEDKYCMIVNLVSVSLAGFFLFILTMASAGVLGNIRDNLQTYCNGGTPGFSTRGLDFYDGSIVKLGESGRFCHVTDCTCTLFTLSNPVEHRYSKYDITGSHLTNSVTSHADKYTRMQQCKDLFQQLTTDKNGNQQIQEDVIKMSAFTFMEDMENKHGCAGICYRSNIGIASDSTSSTFMTNFNNAGPSCLSHVQDHAEDALRAPTILFAVILIYSIITVIFTGCFTCHKDLKYNLVEINWEKRTRKMMQRMGLKANS